MNPFTALPALYRKYVYFTYAALLLVVGAIHVGFDANHLADPAWLVSIGAVLKWLGIPVGALAGSNVTAVDGPPPSPGTPPPPAAPPAAPVE